MNYISTKIKRYDYVINTPYYFNLNALDACWKAGVNYINLGGLFWIHNEEIGKE